MRPHLVMDTVHIKTIGVIRSVHYFLEVKMSGSGCIQGNAPDSSNIRHLLPGRSKPPEPIRKTLYI